MGALGILIGLVAIMIFGLLSGYFLSRDRLVHVATTALERGELPHTTRTNEDFFTECAMLEMQYLRPPGLLLNVFDTRLLSPEKLHPCQMLRVLVTGAKNDSEQVGEPVSYVNYPYGSRHLEAVVLSVMEFNTARLMYMWVSYLSLFALVWSAWRNSSHTALVCLPVWLVLGFAFLLPFFGNNLAHAPGFFSGFVALGIFLAAKSRFTDFRTRLLFFGVLGVIITYFDILTGAIPVVLSLSIALNHFFYVKSETKHGGSYWRVAVTEASGVVICFVAAYLATLLLRLGILSALGIDWHPYFMSLADKFGAVRGNQAIGLIDNITTLWVHRGQLTPGGAQPATWAITLSVASWIFALVAFPFAYSVDRKRAMRLVVNLVVLGMCALGMVAWYVRFPAHTYQHVLFIVRTVSLPIAYGVVAAILVMRELLCGGGRISRVAGGFLLSFLFSIVLLDRVWDLGMSPKILSARFIDSSVDEVSCAADGFHPDGVPDGVVEIVYQPVNAPLSWLGLHRLCRTYIRLERLNPIGAYETGRTLYPLGITSALGGDLLNEKDGGFTSPRRKQVHLFAHFCRDGHDTADSVYQINIEGSIARIAP
jgi:hypothetical protein